VGRESVQFIETLRSPIVAERRLEEWWQLRLAGVRRGIRSDEYICGPPDCGAVVRARVWLAK